MQLNFPIPSFIFLSESLDDGVKTFLYVLFLKLWTGVRSGCVYFVGETLNCCKGENSSGLRWSLKDFVSLANGVLYAATADWVGDFKISLSSCYRGFSIFIFSFWN